MRIRILRVSAAIFAAAAAFPAAAQQERLESRYRTPPPYADPAFPATPVPPPDKSYLIPFGEVLFLNTAIWSWNYAAGKEFAKISWHSIQQNFDKGWIVDTDDFWANQLMHPIHGNLTYNTARSTGLGFYESFGYAFFGSFLWEQLAEIQPPSLNDQVMTPAGGSLVGEALFRMYRLILDSGGYAPSGLRQFFGLLVNPVAGGNRLLFKDRFRGSLLLPPSWMGEFRLGGLVSGSNRNRALSVKEVDIGTWFAIGTDIVYGIPGTPGLELENPFDHFTLAASLSFNGDMAEHPTATLQVRGLLLGETVTFGEGEPDGLWGLFTSYDFIAPAVFRVAGFGVGPGMSLRKRWDWFDLYGTLVAEALPWAGGGSTVALGVRDYHYGPGGSLALEFRGHLSDRAIVRLSGREYWLSGSYAQGEAEDISYAQAALTFRVYGMHGITTALDSSARRARRPMRADVLQHAANFTLYYTILRGW
ncbi:MAG: DUF3943 domain-containing protein [Myxococcales bacterium]